VTDSKKKANETRQILHTASVIFACRQSVSWSFCEAPSQEAFHKTHENLQKPKDKNQVKRAADMVAIVPLFIE